jgi:hypothetical protein
MPILLVRQDKPASCLRMGVPLGRELTTHARLESPVAILKFCYEVLIKKYAGMVTSRVKLINPAKSARDVVQFNPAQSKVWPVLVY